MKKKTLILFAVLITFSLTAFSVINWNNSKTEQSETSTIKEVAVNTQMSEKTLNKIYTDFIYGVGPRFSPIKKTAINKAKSINDFYDARQMESIESLKSVSVILIIDDKQSDIRETGYSEELNPAQLQLLQTADYSTNFVIKSEYKTKNKETGELENSYTTPHLTIVSENQAEYVSGKHALIDYLKEKSKAAVARAMVEPEKLQPAKLFFTVTKYGTIENVHLDRSSNYPSIDKFMA